MIYKFNTGLKGDDSDSSSPHYVLWGLGLIALFMYMKKGKKSQWPL